MIVSLMLLIAITIIGVFVMSSSHLEWLMSNNSRFQSEAGMLAEAALRDGENAIKTTTITWDVTPGFYNNTTLTGSKDPRKISNWSNFTALNATTLTPAKYIVEYLQQTCLGATPPFTTISSCGHSVIYIRMSSYRVWTLSTDSKGAASVTQSNFRMINNPHPPLTIGSNIIPTGTTYQHLAEAFIRQ